MELEVSVLWASSSLSTWSEAANGLCKALDPVLGRDELWQNRREQSLYRVERAGGGCGLQQERNHEICTLLRGEVGNAPSTRAKTA
jgi:hypothetical protein